MGLLHYPTCRAQLRESTWSEVGRMYDPPQMAHFDVGESRRRDLATGSFCLGPRRLPKDNLGPRRLPKLGPASWVM